MIHMFRRNAMQRRALKTELGYVDNNYYNVCQDCNYSSKEQVACELYRIIVNFNESGWHCSGIKFITLHRIKQGRLLREAGGPSPPPQGKRNKRKKREKKKKR